LPFQLTSGLFAAAWLRCPLCRHELEPNEDQLTCPHHGTVASVRDGVLDFHEERVGLDGELVSFWDTSSEYYAATQAANAEIGDSDHATHRRVVGALPQPSRLVLDLGCGTAEASQLVQSARPEAEYVGVDVSISALHLARSLGRPGTFIRASGDRLPFADATFDGVISFFALEHLTTPESVLTEMVRVLAPGGTLILLSVSYDRPFGVVPSQRFGGSHGGRRLPRFHPVNLVVYASNRTRFICRQLLKHVRYRVDPNYVSFERIEHPLALDGAYEVYSDWDAVHVVSGTSVIRTLRKAGVEILETTVPKAGSLRIPWVMLVVATAPFEESPADRMRRDAGTNEDLR
jgi:ubiquinone/menaquinone biosynthesis C-methylase UbiE